VPGEAVDGGGEGGGGGAQGPAQTKAAVVDGTPLLDRHEKMKRKKSVYV